MIASYTSSHQTILELQPDWKFQMDHPHSLSFITYDMIGNLVVAVERRRQHAILKESLYN